MGKYKQEFPEDNPEHPDHDAAVARAWAGDKRVHDNLRKMVDAACKGVMPHIDKRIKDAARRAYKTRMFPCPQTKRLKVARSAL